jgi:NTE family protein
MSALPQAGATDLITGTAVRFGSAASGCARYGRITEPIPVATAVAASAAYPLLLPALERQLTFSRDGQQRVEPVLLTDGGAYDNLGLSVLEPDRSPAFTDHVYNVPYIISCDAGRGPLAPKAPHFLASRAARAFEIVHQRAQYGGRARLHEWASTGRLNGFVMAYLGMRDDRLPVPLADLAPRDLVATYPTNLAAMSQCDLDLLSTRGEQLIRTLLPIYCPDLA